MRTLSLTLLTTSAFATNHSAHGDHGAHAGHGQAEACGCAALEADHPFTIDCAGTAAIRAAGVTLAACNSGVPDIEFCEHAIEDGTDPACQIAFFVLQSHHDYCEHDTLTSTEEALVHDWEDVCMSCAISRGYEAGLFSCPTVDCSDSGIAEAAVYVLNTTCTPMPNVPGELQGEATSCCSNPLSQGAFRTVIAYHDLCDHDDVPEFVEDALHFYEHECEMHFCNAVDASYNGATCPSPPGMEYVTSAFTMSGDVSDFGPTEIHDIEHLLHEETGVEEDHIEVFIAPGSVQITTIIETANAATVSTTLSTGIMASASALQTALQAEGFTGTVAAITTTPTVSASAPTPSPPPLALSDSDELSSTALIIIIICGAIAVMALIMICHMYRNEKKGTPIFTSLASPRKEGSNAQA